jgi:shikimate 5-dehydrogenase
LLQRWKTYFPNKSFADLDEEIEKHTKKSVSEIFKTDGEAQFRKHEKEVWEKIQAIDVISVGGGFNLDWVQNREIFWARRDSDGFDRIFIDRPALSDYPKRYQERDIKFQECADFIYTMPEGIFGFDEEEKRILSRDFKNLGGAVTVPRVNFPNTLIEVRDDLPLKEYKNVDVLFSVRTGCDFPKDVKVDWDIKRPLPENLQPYIISTHENSLEPLKPFENSSSILKYCPEVKTWNELKAGYLWQQKNPKLRAFLPRSQNGRWSWFRLWMKGKQPLNFWREGSGTSVDQPTLWEWMSHPDNAENFAAVLGAPVRHSYSPMYHKTFFKSQRVPFYKIHIEENEWSEAFPILEEWGLIAAAVTSPLKQKAGELVRKNPLNTLWKIKNSWRGESTDTVGALALMKNYFARSIVVWGGGGVLDALKEVLPQASYYSAQKGQPRDGSKEISNSEVLVWGDPHNSIDHVPVTWRPQIVIDLSYHDRSPARIYALKTGAQYISGHVMFTAQAQEQQTLWEEIFA